jgi:integrase/recombinase XerD
MDHNNTLFQFTEHLKALARTATTVEAYTYHVGLFLKGVAKDIKAVTRRDLEAYIAGLFEHRTKDGKAYATGTIIIKVRSLKRFFEFLEARNVIFVSPMEFIGEPQKERRLPRNILTSAEIQKILGQPNLGTLTGIRDRTVLELFYSTGIRLNELCKLTIYDADLQGGMLRINRGKGRKDRVVPLGKHAIRFLREYITKVRPHCTRNNKQNRSLLVDRFGKPISDQVVTILIRTHAKAAGIEKKVTAHVFRHTFASHLVKNGADIVAVQKMLGHADLGTTQGYISALGLDMKKAHKQSHPREKDKASQGSVKPEITRFKPEHERKQPLTTGG